MVYCIKISSIKQSGGVMYGVNTYTFCTDTGNFWDGYNIL